MNEPNTIVYREALCRVRFERSAVKGVDGFSVEASADDPIAAFEQANKLYDLAKKSTEVIM